MGSPSTGRWWRRGREEAQAAAQEAAGRAAPLLIDVDRLQGEAAEGLRMLQAVDPGPTAQRVAADWDRVQEQANQAVAAYLAATGLADLNTDLEGGGGPPRGAGLPRRRGADGARRRRDPALPGRGRRRHPAGPVGARRGAGAPARPHARP